ncbi:MAG TPA: DNA-directed RNA polymerase subunit D [Candidatus Nanoarchaeia archaeon]|nr:DNA-directed RNA polymerase subunit D [Candidatus Nanoarchaeia archaeon]
MNIVEKKGNRIGFVLNTNESLVNAIRRSVNEIPVVAIDEVEIHKNDSALYDEIISHRLGLIPIKSNRKLEVHDESSDGKKSLKSELQITLKAKGPCTVYSKDLKGDMEPVYDKIPIVLLTKDQELEILSFARLGVGEKHSKFSPGLVYYRHASEIKIKNADKAQEIINKIKDTLIDSPKGNVKNGDVLKSYMDVDYVESFLGEEKESPVEIKHGEEIVFFIESWGQIENKEIFSEAVKALDKNLKEVLKAPKK